MVKSKKSRKAKVIPKTRKELRKEKRTLKKINKKSFFSKKNDFPVVKISQKDTENDLNDEIESSFELSDDEIKTKITKFSKTEVVQPKKEKKQSTNALSETDKFLEMQKREKKKQKELEKKMRKQRIVLLKEANEDEDKIIRKLEKKLNIDKHRNEKSVHKMFNDGLDYALELCLPDNIQKMYSTAKETTQLNDESDNDFQEDLAIALGKDNKTIVKQSKIQNLEFVEKKTKLELKETENKYLGDFESDLSATDSEFDDNNNGEESDGVSYEAESESKGGSDCDILNTDIADVTHSEGCSVHENDILNNLVEDIDKGFQNDKKIKSNTNSSNEQNSGEDADNYFENTGEDEEKGNSFEESKKAWEDIYGRKRDADGNIIKENTKKYMPPHVRARLENQISNDPKLKEKLDRLRKQCKGFLNRLSEANIHKIASDIEKLYMNNSRFDMNNTISQLIFETLVSNVLANERMVLEHTMLIAILHANVGSEIGAHFLQSIINMFDNIVRSINILDVENKELDNIVLILAHLYTFKIFQHSLIFEIIKKLIEKLCEKSVECLLLMLRSIGFQLRKDDPIALKNLILSIQKQTNSSELNMKENPRFKYMLEILNAIKNNNMNKIPQYDPELAEHLKKILKSMLSNGKYVSTLNITMEDLLKADEKGKWWVVGSAWSGNKDSGSTKLTSKNAQKFSEKLLELAKKQRMNTDDRRNVFCIIMSAEDYIDAFERLLHLSLKDQKIISSIIIHCCLSENIYNPYYAVLGQKFCDYDRKYQLAIQFAIWDRIKDISSVNKQQIKNLAQFLIFLIVQGAQPLSILKVIEFAELDKITLHLVRQIFLGILLGKEIECRKVFERIAPSIKLNNFKDSIKLFMHHFLLKGANTNEIPSEQLVLMKQRISLADRALAFNDSKLRF